MAAARSSSPRPNSSSSNPLSAAGDPAISAAAASLRRLPPPCWTQEETSALIQAYRDKWYALRRGNLRAPHWDEVSHAVAARCRPLYASGSSGPVSLLRPKTAVQCRHKMEKLRKRYRSETARPHRTSWVHFPEMDALETGRPPAAAPAAAVTVAVAPPAEEESEEGYEEEEERKGVPLCGKKRTTDDATDDVAAAVRRLGDGFLRVEEMKMEMAREMERVRMEMEIKRTEMLLDSQRWIVDIFLDGLRRERRRKLMKPKNN